MANERRPRPRPRPETATLPTDEHIESALLALVAQRGPDSSACPSEVARQLSNDAWRDLMPRVRQVAAQLAIAGRISVTQRGVPLHPAEPWRGPIRITVSPPGRS